MTNSNNNNNNIVVAIIIIIGQVLLLFLSSSMMILFTVTVTTKNDLSGRSSSGAFSGRQTPAVVDAFTIQTVVTIGGGGGSGSGTSNSFRRKHHLEHHQHYHQYDSCRRYRQHHSCSHRCRSMNLKGQLSSSPSYSDDFLLNFHNQAQGEKQATTNSLRPYNDMMSEEQSDIQEWKDSFDRNGFADFTPPMTEGLNCLMVGDGVRYRRRGGKMVPKNTKSSTTTTTTTPTAAKLPWEEEHGADVTAMEIIEINMNNNSSDDDHDAATKFVADVDPNPVGVGMVDNIVDFETRPVIFDRGSKNGNNMNDGIFERTQGLKVSDPDRPASVYDCIVDQGLMDSVLSLYRQQQEEQRQQQQQQPKTSSSERNADIGFANDSTATKTTTTMTVSDDIPTLSSSTSSSPSSSEPSLPSTVAVEELMLEAATAIREHGIYVLVTSKENLSSKTRHLLDTIGKSVGLEWNFELDGISNTSNDADSGGGGRVVSVARRYCTGEMPKVGKLATTNTNKKKSRYQV